MKQPAPAPLREHAISIWQAGVDAVRARTLLLAALNDPQQKDLSAHLSRAARQGRILVVGAGKAGAEMAASVEEWLGDSLDCVEGVVNVPGPAPGQTLPPLRKIRLQIARPAGSNHPTAAGVVGARAILDLVSHAGPSDVALCLLSGGGSALLPAPVAGITLEDKQQVTKLLHSCGATINELNCVRKHLSAIKGGRLAEAFAGRALFSLIISDVVGDPLDVIASGPTAPDPTTFATALAVLEKYQLGTAVPTAVWQHLQQGAAGVIPDTPRSISQQIHNIVIGNNARALEAAQREAESRGYRVLNLGPYLEGETREVGVVLAGLIRSIRRDGVPLAPPVCVLSGGETTVTLTPDHGLGGRNQELILAMLCQLGVPELKGVALLSGGTDGEDGPTDAAGAVADAETLQRAEQLGLEPRGFLVRNDAYHFFAATEGLLKTGLTGTNVMDLRVFLVTHQPP